jgi:hypothetical protein
MTARRGGKEGGGDCEPYGSARDDENAPLHSPKLTQRRTHPAVIYSTPAGERKRPRVRPCHEQKTRGLAERIPTRRLIKRDSVSNIGRSALVQPVGLSLSCFRYRALAAVCTAAPPTGQSLPDQTRQSALCAASERRQNFNLYGLSQLLLKIFLMGRASINQYRAHLDNPVETRIGPLLGGEPQSFSNRLSLYCFLGDACCGPGPSPVMKGNRHHCVTLKHALRPYRGGLKASTGTES